MALKIKAWSFAEAWYLVVDSDGVGFCKSAAFARKRKFRFDEIDLVLLGEDNVLAFQVGNETFSIPTKPHKRKHQQAIENLVRAVQQTAARA